MSPQIEARKPSLKSKQTRIGMLSLGCPKTLVDSEVILGKLNPEQYKITTSVADCDVALLNTCAFIQDAQQESVDRILDLIQLKKSKQIQAIIVMGCLVQRFPGDLQKQLKEVDAFIGSGEYAKIPELVEKVTGGKKVLSVGAAGYLSTAAEPRIALTPKHYRYLKISEGCDHICSFCSIPSFRGKHRSRTIEDVKQEASHFIEQGARELILTGQDTTYFGRDYSGKFLLPDLIREVDSLKGDFWFRILYAYPSCVTKEMMEAIRDAKNVCHYLDMPLQHASDPMLQAMRRGITARRTRDLIQQFRATVPDLAIRTTFIVGFPGETEKDFEELLAFIKETEFERLGIFTYSKEEGTHSASLPGHLPEKVKRERLDIAMRLQQEIAAKKNRAFVGKTLRVLIDDAGDKPGTWSGRTYRDAPEVDAGIRVESAKPLTPGNFQSVRITSAEIYDLVGEV